MMVASIAEAKGVWLKRRKKIYFLKKIEIKQVHKYGAGFANRFKTLNGLVYFLFVCSKNIW